MISIKRKAKKAGFTLIELLVVISIIALLSSIILAAVSGARGRASVAAGQTFSGHLTSAFYSNALVYYDFVGATTAYIPNLGTSVGSVAVEPSLSFPSDSSLYSTGNSLLIPQNKTNPVIFTATDNSIDNAYTAGNYTFSLWFKPTGSTAATPEIIALDPGGNGLTSYITVTYSGSSITAVNFGSNTAGIGTNYITYNTNMSSSQWTHIAVAVKNIGGGLAKAALYVNGSLVASNNSFTPKVAPGSNSLLIGGNCCGWSAGGYYDNVQFFSQSLLASDIMNIYAYERKSVLALK